MARRAERPKKNQIIKNHGPFFQENVYILRNEKEAAPINFDVCNMRHKLTNINISLS